MRAEVVNPDPTEDKAKVISLERPDVTIDKPAPASQFTKLNGEAFWKEARDRALKRLPNHSGGAFDFSLVPDDFRSATNFYNERYNPGDAGENLSVIISAAKAEKKGNILELTQMRMIYFITETPPPPPPNPGDIVLTAAGETPAVPVKTVKPGQPATKPRKDKDKDKGKDKDKKDGDVAGGMSMPGGGRMVILAPKCEIDLDTNVGYATGNASIEIFPKPEDGKPLKSIAKLTSPYIHWRSWNEASSGSTEIVLYTCSADDAAGEPEVSGTYINRLPDGSESTIHIKGYGMIFESGKYDRPSPRADEDDRTVGLSLVARSRALFHKNVSTEMTATTIQSLMPFQGEPPPIAKASKDPKANPKKKPAVEQAQEHTLVTCDGPAIFDLALVPRLNDPVVEATSVSAETVEVDLKEILLGKRYEFLNNVKLVKRPLNPPPAEAGAPDSATRMSCGHLRIQYPPGALPSATSMPDYTEAIGGVKMSGYKLPPPPTDESQPVMPPTPFSVSCDRMFFDGLRDNMFLVGTTAAPARIIDSAGMAVAQQFCFRRKSQMMIMPSFGPKQMIIRPDTSAAKPAGAPGDPAAQGSILGGGDTFISWNGPLYREVLHLPVPQKKDQIKEIMTLNNNVLIEQKEKGLRMTGEKIRLYRDLEKNQVEFIDANGDVVVVLGELKVVGHIVTVDMAFDDNNQPTKDMVTVIGDRKTGKKADAYKGGGSAVRSDKFIIDRLSDNFSAFGGTVAVVKSPAAPPEEPKSDAAQGAGGLLGGVKFGGGNIFIQCDGEFIQDGKAHTVTCDQNVILRQPGMELLANNVLISLGDDATPADPKKPAAAKAPGATPANALFSGDLKTIECFGMVELATAENFIHCDLMKFDATSDQTILDMLDAEDDVRVYIFGADGNDQVMCSRHSLKLDKKTGTFTPGGQLLILPYKEKSPAPRGAENSPSRRKAK